MYSITVIKLHYIFITTGISYNLDGVALSGNQLGKAYTFSGLQKHRGVSYDQGRDNALIEALMQPQHLANAPGEQGKRISKAIDKRVETHHHGGINKQRE